MPDDRTIALKPIKWYKNLATRKGRLEAEAFLIEGDRAIKQIISSNPDDIIEIVSTEELSPFYHKYSTSFLIMNKTAPELVACGNAEGRWAEATDLPN